MVTVHLRTKFEAGVWNSFIMMKVASPRDGRFRDR
jgi:hypothetical protein